MCESLFAPEFYVQTFIITHQGILFDVLINTILRTQKFYIVSTGILYYALRNLIL